MSSPTDICNEALVEIGGDLITDIGGTSDKERLCNRLYDTTRRQLLRMHLWNFALQRASLKEDPATPAFGFDRAYTLPADYIRILAIGRDESLTRISLNILFRIENGRLLTDESDVKVLYVFDIKAVEKFDSLFRALLAKLLEHKMAFPIMNNRQLAKDKLVEFKDMLIEGRVADAHEGSPPTVFDNDLVAARRTSSALSANFRPIRFV